MFDDSIASAITYTEDGLRQFGYVSDADLQVRYVRDAVATRRDYDIAAKAFSGALYDSAGALIAASQRHNRGDIVPADAAQLTAEARQGATRHPARVALYGGILFPILGHFLVESLARLWPLLCAHPGREPPLVCFHHWPNLDMPALFANPLYVAALAAFGVSRENVLLLDRDVRFDTLLLPDPASRYHIDMNTRMADLADHLVATLAPRDPPAATKLYLSRSLWGANTRIANEADIDALAESRGFRVVHPQRTEPAALLGLLAGARTVMASDGSHAHLALFCRPGTRVVMLDTRPVPTQFAIARLRGFRTLHLPLFDDPAFHPGQRLADPAALGPRIDAALAQLAD